MPDIRQSTISTRISTFYLTGMLFLILGIIGYAVYDWYGYKNYGSRKNWDPIKSCLAEGNLCKDFEKIIPSSIQMPIQSGCCGFHLKNATFWEVPASGPAPDNPDCRKWSNNRDKLCYDCNSCKAGFMVILKISREYLLIFDICVIVVLLGVYSIGCCAWRQNYRENRNYQGTA